MTTLTVPGTLLRASRDDRTITYRLLPYDTPGATSLGRVIASKGCLTLPDDPSAVKLNDRHIADRILASGASLEWGADALIASFHVHDGPAGDDLLDEAERVRAGAPAGVELRGSASVEVDNPRIRAGKLLGGLLTAAGAVVRPAFAGANLLASDVGDLPEDFPDYLKPSESSSQSTEELIVNGVTYVVKSTSEHKTEVTPKSGETDPEREGDDPDATDDPEDPMTASAPADLTASRTSKKAKPDLTPRDVARMLAAAASTRDPDIMKALGAPEVAGASKLFAALNDVKYDGTGGLSQTITLPQWVGALWTRRTYARRFIPLIPSEDLTSLEIKGFDFDTEPEVAEWAGNKSAVPSNTITATQRGTKAKRLAGGHDIAREYRDFNVEGFWEAYFAAMTNSYAKKSDLGTLADMVAGATRVVSGAAPVGVPAGLVKVVDGALSFIDDAAPSFAVVAKDLWRDILLTPTDKTLEYLNSALGLEEGSLDGFKLVPGPITAGTVLVGAREAATSYELPSSPIRVEALDLVKGGIDEAFFGYYGTLINKASLLAHVDAPAA